MTPKNDSSSGAPSADAVTEIALLPCPFCGGEPSQDSEAVQCYHCGARIGSKMASRATIRTWWNTRTVPSLEPTASITEDASDSSQIRVPERNESSSAKLEDIAREAVEQLRPAGDGERVTLFNVILSALTKTAPAAPERNAGRELKVEQAIEAEVIRWQDGIEKVIRDNAPKANIDGGGCDSGDPLDFTLAEIGQAFAYWDNRAFDALQEMGLSAEGYPSALEALIDIFPNDSVDADTDGQRREIIELREQLRELKGKAPSDPEQLKSEAGTQPSLGDKQIFDIHKRDELRNEGQPGMPHGPCQCEICKRVRLVATPPVPPGQEEGEPIGFTDRAREAFKKRFKEYPATVSDKWWCYGFDAGNSNASLREKEEQGFVPTKDLWIFGDSIPAGEVRPDGLVTSWKNIAIAIQNIRKEECRLAAESERAGPNTRGGQMAGRGSRHNPTFWIACHENGEIDDWTRPLRRRPNVELTKGWEWTECELVPIRNRHLPENAPEPSSAQGVSAEGEGEKAFRESARVLVEAWDAQHQDADLNNPDPGDKAKEALNQFIKAARKYFNET